MIVFKIEDYRVRKGERISRAGHDHEAVITVTGGRGETIDMFFAERPSMKPYVDERRPYALCQASLDQFDWHVDLLRNEKSAYGIIDKRDMTRIGLRSSPLPVAMVDTPDPYDLEDWLSANPEIAEAIVWHDADGPHAYRDWSRAWRRDLRAHFHHACSMADAGLTYPPRNLISTPDQGYPETAISGADAGALYMSNIAQCLAAEFANWTRWSLAGLSRDNKRELLSSEAFFFRDSQSGNYAIDPRKLGFSLPAPGNHAAAFLVRNGLMGHDARRTVANLLNWCHRNLVHFRHGFTVANCRNYWDYAGLTPLTRIMAARKGTPTDPSRAVHATAGCWGTMGFLRNVLRVVNIPVTMARHPAHAHAMVEFPSLGLYLSHADDPYDPSVYTIDPFDMDDLLIDRSTFQAWFGPHVAAARAQANVARRANELAVEHLAIRLLHYHCDDTAHQRPPERSRVYLRAVDGVDGFALDQYFTVAELKAKGLWDRLDRKIAELGGCAAVMKIEERPGH